jgi:guanine nucleotide-binding protein G(i) subunit alpha
MLKIHTGSGESGKTTISKQIQIVYQGGFTTEELMEKRSHIYKNIAESITVLIREIKRLDATFANPENNERARRIEDFYERHDMSIRITPELADLIDGIWHDENVGPFMDRSSEFYIMDSAP